MTFFFLQTVASIEERTRPNLSKTLKGITRLSRVGFQDAALNKVTQLHPLCVAYLALFCTVQQNVLHYPSMCNMPFSGMSFELLEVKCGQVQRKTWLRSELLAGVN